MSLFCAICLLLFAITPFLGVVFIPPISIFDYSLATSDIFWCLRLPRTTTAFLAGAGLSVSGVVFQAMFRNNLASPFTLGISSGAAFGASLYFTFFSTTLITSLGTLGSAFTGAIVSMLLVLLIISFNKLLSTTVMLLSGVIVSFFFSSMIMFVQYCSNSQETLTITRWLMGSITPLDPFSLLDLSLIVLCATSLLLRLAPALDLLLTGEDIAASRGLNVHTIKLVLFFCASLIPATIVSLTGPIGFVGMIIPNICRLLFGSSNKILILSSFLLGGTFLNLCDLLSRLLLAPADLPVGILTAMTGCPFFLWALLKNKHNSIR